MQNQTRCEWCLSSELYTDYHDREWGVPTFDDFKHFEFLLLESAQSGLSWITILKKRENYRKAYDNFNFEKVARYDEKRVELLMQDRGIVRNRLKILASINNAKKFIEIREEFGTFSEYIWAFTRGKPIIGRWASLKEIPSKTELSDALAKDLKKRGFKSLGSVVMYSHMQAMGLVNDHMVDCFRFKELIS